MNVRTQNLLPAHRLPQEALGAHHQNALGHDTPRHRSSLDEAGARWRQFMGPPRAGRVMGVAGPTDTHTALQGAWNLERFVVIDEHGASVDWFSGREGPMMGSGTIIYSGDQMAVSLNSEGEVLSPAAKALGGILFYAGPFEVRGDTVTHKVSNASHPSLKHNFQRKVEFSRDRKTLRLVGSLGDGREVVVEWRRLDPTV